MNDRIKKVREDAHLSQEKFARKLNLSRQYVALLESGDRLPSSRTVADICREFNISESWLRNGDGPMERPQEPDRLDDLLESEGIPPDMRPLFVRLMSLPPERLEIIMKLVNEFSAESPSSGADPPAD